MIHFDLILKDKYESDFDDCISIADTDNYSLDEMINHIIHSYITQMQNAAQDEEYYSNKYIKFIVWSLNRSTYRTKILMEFQQEIHDDYTIIDFIQDNYDEILELVENNKND